MYLRLWEMIEIHIFQSSAYQKLVQDKSATKSHDGENPPPYSSAGSRKSAARAARARLLKEIAACTTALFVTLGVGLWAFHSVSSSIQLDAPTLESNLRYSCGSNIAEAKALCCEWDLLSAAWVPPSCIDAELTESFRKEDQWRYFADQNGTIELEEASLSSREGGLEGQFWASLKWHTVHCGYEWRRMHRAMQKGRRIDTALADYRHTEHCGGVFLDRSPLDKLLTKITVEFLSC